METKYKQKGNRTKQVVNSKQASTSGITDHGSKFHQLHKNTAGIYFIKESNTEMVLKVVSFHPS